MLNTSRNALCEFCQLIHEYSKEMEVITALRSTEMQYLEKLPGK